MTNNEPLKGSCFCEAVSYELAVPLSEIASRGCFCNCRVSRRLPWRVKADLGIRLQTCQKLFGDRAFDVALPLAQFKVTKGSPSSFSDTQTASGKAMVRYFCPSCGSGLYTTSEARPERVWVKVSPFGEESESQIAADALFSIDRNTR